MVNCDKKETAWTIVENVERAQGAMMRHGEGNKYFDVIEEVTRGRMLSLNLVEVFNSDMVIAMKQQSEVSTWGEIWYQDSFW